MYVLSRRYYRTYLCTCLKMKRTVERSVNPQNVRMACGEIDAVLEDFMGETKIVKIIKDKYDSTGYTK